MALLHPTVPDNFLLVHEEFAPYCTTVSEARLKLRSSLATLTQLESSLLTGSASLSAMAGLAGAAAAAAEAGGVVSVLPCGSPKLPPGPLPPPPQPASAPAATHSRRALLSIFLTLSPH
ncbi:hypothetical protein A8M77_17335 [Variovorax sp. JS1663]|nr:hypothetical protein A8M77_17335 [Variovorax sp. JS1663]